MAVTVPIKRVLYVFDRSGKSVERYFTNNIGIRIHSVAISLKGEYIVAGSWRRLSVFERSNAREVWGYRIGKFVRSVAISPDGKYIVAGCDDKNVYLFSMDGSLLWRYKTGYDVESVAIRL